MKLAAALLGPLLVGAAVSCSGGELVFRPPPTVLGDGRFRLALGPKGNSLVLTRDRTTLLTLEPDAFALGVVDVPDDHASWDPIANDPRVTFRVPRDWSASFASPPTDGTIDLDYGDGIIARVAIGVAGGTRFSLSLSAAATPPGKTVVEARVRVRTNGEPSEAFYGLGGHGDDANNRGLVRAMQLEATDLVNTPSSLVLATSGWGMFVDSRRIGAFYVATHDASLVDATFAVAATDGTGRAESLHFDLFGGDTPLDLYADFVSMAGAPRPPPSWAFGALAARSTDVVATQIDADMTTLRTADVALSGFVLEASAETAVGTFDFDPARFPDAPGLTARAHAAGMRVAAWSAPNVDPKATTAAAAAPFFCTTSAVLANPWSKPIDFTSLDAGALWRGFVHRLATAGVDGYLLDAAQDIVPANGTLRNPWSFSDGSDERTMHRRYSGLYHRIYVDGALGREPTVAPKLDAELPAIFARTAHFGDDSGLVIVPAALDASYAGLASGIAFGLSVGSSGFPYFAAEVPADASDELFVRWVEAMALTPTLLVAQPSEPHGNDAMDVYRTYARLHTQLYPYLETYAERARVDGKPLIRPVGLAHPELGLHPSDVWLLGDDLFVAPVLTSGESRHHVVLPAGQWFDFWTGASLTDEGDVDASKLPLLLRDGAIVPLLRDTISTLAPTTDAKLDSFANDAGMLTALIAPGTPRAFTLWDGTRIARVDAATYDVAPGTVFTKGTVLELIATPKPQSVDVADDAWSWTSERGGTVRVTVAGQKQIHVR